MRLALPQLLALVVFCFTVVGCCGASGPAVSQHHRNGWLVINCHAEIFDLKTGRRSTAAPIVRSVVGEQVFRDLALDAGDRLFYCVPSPDGRYFACKSRSGSLYLVDLVADACSIVEVPRVGYCFGSMSWRPNRAELLCLVFRDSGSGVRSGRLYLLTKVVEAWMWTEVVQAGELQGRPGEYEITEKAWDSDDSFVYSSKMSLTRFHLDTGQVEPCGYGHAAYGLGKGCFVYRTESDLWTPFLMARKSANAAAPVVLEGSGITLNGWPCISPDGKYILFLEKYLSSVLGQAAIRRDVCMYDCDKKTFRRLFSGFWHGPEVEVVATALWINPCAEVGAKLRLDQARKLRTGS